MEYFLKFNNIFSITPTAPTKDSLHRCILDFKSYKHFYFAGLIFGALKNIILKLNNNIDNVSTGNM